MGSPRTTYQNRNNSYNNNSYNNNRYGNRNHSNRPTRGPVSQGERDERPQYRDADLTRCSLQPDHARNLLDIIGQKTVEMVRILDLEGELTYRTFYDRHDGYAWLETIYRLHPPKSNQPQVVKAVTKIEETDDLESPISTVETNDFDPNEEQFDTVAPVMDDPGEVSDQTGIRYFMRMGGRSTDRNGHYRNTVVIFSPSYCDDQARLPQQGIIVQSDPSAIARLVTM